MIHILYPRVDCLKTIPFTAAHTYIVHIWQYLPRVHTALANFDVILVEKAVVFVLFREVLRNKFEKCSADVSLDVFTERRVVPDNISLSVASRSCRLLVFVVGQCFRIAAGFQS